MKILHCALALSLWTTAVFAHTPLDGTTPADNAVVTTAPTEIVLDFKGDIRLTRVTLAFAQTDPIDLDLGTQTSFASDFILPMENTDAGDYTVEWRGLGTDGHTLTGTFQFTVR